MKLIDSSESSTKSNKKTQELNRSRCVSLSKYNTQSKKSKKYQLTYRVLDNNAAFRTRPISAWEKRSNIMKAQSTSRRASSTKTTNNCSTSEIHSSSSTKNLMDNQRDYRFSRLNKITTIKESAVCKILLRTRNRLLQRQLTRLESAIMWSRIRSMLSTNLTLSSGTMSHKTNNTRTPKPSSSRLTSTSMCRARMASSSTLSSTFSIRNWSKTNKASATNLTDLSTIQTRCTKTRSNSRLKLTLSTNIWPTSTIKTTACKRSLKASLKQTSRWEKVLIERIKLKILETESTTSFEEVNMK